MSPTFRRRSGLAALLLVAFAAGGVGCAGNQQSSRPDETPDEADESDDEQEGPETITDARKRRDGLSREGKQVETFDLDRDQKADQWEVRSEEGELLWIARDMNFDGQVDVWQYPDADGEVVEEEMDLDMDGTVDLVTHYKGGEIRRKELSVNFDEQFSIVKFYNKKGNLLRVERDEDGDGEIDVWEYYDSNGNRERIGWDDNGDGVPDTFDDSQ